MFKSYFNDLNEKNQNDNNPHDKPTKTPASIIPLQGSDIFSIIIIKKIMDSVSK